MPHHEDPPQVPSSPKTQTQTLDPQDQSEDDDFEMVTPIPRANPDQRFTTNTYTRRPNNRKSALHLKRLAALEKKSQPIIEALSQTLEPIPFTPNRNSVDFSRHEPLLRRLGLWDFVHLELDRNIRKDLITQLIATYCCKSRCSYVSGERIHVNRADLARALKLPVKKTNSNVSISDVSVGFDGEKETEDSIGFIVEKVLGWMLLHDDTCIMPVDVVSLTNSIKEGNFGKIDWAGLIWSMMEKELLNQKLRHCYYASYMQHLIKCQKEDLLGEEVKQEVEEVKEEQVKDGQAKQGKVEDADGDVKMLDGVDDSKPVELEENNIEFSLGQENDVNLNEDVDKEEKKLVGDEDVLHFEENRNEEQDGQCSMDGESNVDKDVDFLRRCTLGDVKSMDLEEENKQVVEEEVEEEGKEEEEEGEEEEEEEEEEDQDGGFSLQPRGGTLERVTSANLIQGLEAVEAPFGTGIQHSDIDLHRDFFSSAVDTNTIPGGSSSHFGNGKKREFGHENELFHHSLNEGNKRLRSGGSWENKSSSEFDACMEQMQHWMEKARIAYETKDQACGQSSVNQQILLTELQKRDSMIDQLHKAKFEEQQKRQREVYRLERELYMMGDLLDGYRKALQEAQKRFAEYRARCPQLDEPLYKDVKGGGGLVLSTMELEKLRLKQEEEERVNRLLIENKIKDFEAEWIGKFEAHGEGANLLCKRLLDVENSVKSLKELHAKPKLSETAESTPDE